MANPYICHGGFLRLKDLIFPKINLKELPIIDILSLFILHSKYYSHGIKNNRKGSCVVFKLDIVKIGDTNTIDTLHFLFFTSTQSYVGCVSNHSCYF